MNEICLTTNSPEETDKLGKILGSLLQPGDTVLLGGHLGAGKTLFSKGIAKGLGVHEQITSPTFTIVAEYAGQHPFVHMDLYRLYGDGELTDAEILSGQAHLSPSMLDSIGFNEYLDGQSVLLIEWPQGVVDEFEEAIHIYIEISPTPRTDERTFHIRGVGARSLRLVDEWVKQWQF